MFDSVFGSRREVFSVFMQGALRNVGMVSSPGYFSGRGANGSDLNKRILDGLFDAITKEKGAEAGKAFVQMVADIPVLSATDFLVTLAGLEANDFVWDKQQLSRQKGIHVENYEEFVGTLGSALGRRDQQDSTVEIREMFLLKHGVLDPRGKRLRDIEDNRYEYHFRRHSR